jgi:hypothetical protein
MTSQRVRFAASILVLSTIAPALACEDGFVTPLEHNLDAAHDVNAGHAPVDIHNGSLEFVFGGCPTVTPAALSVTSGEPCFAESELAALRDNFDLSENDAQEIFEQAMAHASRAQAKSDDSPYFRSGVVEDPIGDYEPYFPYTEHAPLPGLEAALLNAYLDTSNNAVLVKLLAAYHLSRCRTSNTIRTGVELKHTIIADYFLNRAHDLGARDRWIALARKKLNHKLEHFRTNRPAVALDEDHPAQVFFNDTFFDHEENRHLAQSMLLDDLVAHPNNVYTTFLNVAVNNWNAGEAKYDDPILLYNFLISGFASFHAMDLSKEAELAWSQDPAAHSRFRLASIVGGFSAMQRRSMAKIHRDPEAIAAIDVEHREWRLINKAFHAFTIGLTFFEEDENFLEAYNAWEDAFLEGMMRPELVTVQDRPRFTFNLEGMFVTRADFALKRGEFEKAYTYLAVAQNFMPNSAYWDYGREAVLHRQQFAGEIAARYANNNPSDDPVPFMVKRHKWGGPDSTCQVCHQRQSKIWSEAEKENILLAPDDILTVGTFPERRTTWYGTIPLAD